MNLFSLVWNYLKARPLSTALNIFLLALGIAVITVLLLFNNQLKEKISSNSRGIDLVVGAKGSPLQIILCNIFHIDFPTGNIKLRDAERVARHRLIKKVIPMSLGDSYNGYRIVGTTQEYPALYGATLIEGSWWKEPLQVVVGSVVAELAKLKMGDTFISAHGLTIDGQGHEQHKYVVSGVMKRTNSVLDNLILSDIASIWMVHDLADSLPKPLHPSSIVPVVEEGDSSLEITSLLVQYRNPLAVIQLPRFVNSQSSLQAAAPAFETARLFSILGAGAEVIRAFAFVLILISSLSIFIALYNSLKERQYDMAIMRSMGASRTKLFTAMILEGSWLTVAGSALGLLLGHGVLAAFVLLAEEGRKAGMTASVFYPEESIMLVASLLLGVLCSLIPAIQAYRTDIHKVLAGG